MANLPDWTFKGGSFRSKFSENDIPTNWIRSKGKWQRNELIPYGKATDEYKQLFYNCPECKKPLELSETPYQFNCFGCLLDLNFSFGSLKQIY